EALNKKNIPLTIKKLRNGALIVENAGGLTLESVNIITDALRQETEPVLVVLEGSSDTMLPILHGSRYMPEVFDARIDIAPYTNDDLVAYGRGYAREQGYSIDDMGVLALYTRIGEMQSLDHQVSIEEVREIVDAAIKHVDRKTMAHFMDVLLAKRYDDDDYIVLREKDFII
ncbi:MAG: AAA family ATPase, partial [Lachnospiraceae bacterium]|nr:AAA family ATPase [Lachnospiraceae bacterium]